LGGLSKRKSGDLLSDLNRRVLVIKDLTTILEKRYPIPNELFASLRSISDGYFARQTAFSEGVKEWSGLFGIIAACTSAIDGYEVVQRNLGERFLKVRFHGEELTEEDELKEGIEAARTVEEGMEEEIREDIAAATAEVVEPFRNGFSVPRLSKTQNESVARYARLAAHARHHVKRVTFHHTPLTSPDVERPGRISKQLAVLVQCNAALRKHSTIGQVEMDVMRRVAFDCIPKDRGVVLRTITKASGRMGLADLSRETGLYKSTLSTFILPDLEAGHVIGSVGDNPHVVYEIEPEYAKLVKEVRFK